MSNSEVQDPVCGMRFEAEDAHATLVRDGRTHHFCCDGCRSAFEADPDRYAVAPPLAPETRRST